MKNAIAPAPRGAGSVTATAGHRIKSLSIVGGFLDGVTLDLATGLNCVIGARGTGKTTILELIRFVLDALPSPDLDPQARRRIESLIGENLNGGRAELTIETGDGMTYIVTRAAGDDPIVLDSDRRPAGISFKAGRLFAADVFSQNEIETIADQPALQLSLIDHFEADAIATVNAEIKSLRNALEANAGRIAPLQSRIAALGDDLAGLSSIEEKLRAYGGSGEQSTDDVNRAHALKALRDREKRTLDASSRFLADYGDQLASVNGQVAAKVNALFIHDVGSGPNSAAITHIRQAMLDCGKDVDAGILAARRRVGAMLAQLANDAQSLQLRHNEQEIAFQELMQRHQAAQGQAAERSRLERARNELLMQQRAREELCQQLDILQAERDQMLDRLSELCDRRFSIRRQLAESISTNLRGSVRVEIAQSGDPRQYIELLTNALRTARVKSGVVAAKLARAFWPARLSEIIRAADTQPLIDDADLNEDQARKVIETLAGSDTLFKLEIVELEDLPRIELSDGGGFRPSPSLSTGQKCTTILPILLLESDRPLLIDQPEDNLDNRFIFECVVGSIQAVKSTRQLVFVTHNPNIPVLADAERVFVLESDGKRGALAAQGSVDECKQEIMTLLEGGAEAFALRQSRYGCLNGNAC